MPVDPASPSLPLSALLQAAGQALAAVHAGRSLSDALGEVEPAARPGAQALAYDALRHWGMLRPALKGLIQRAPPAPVQGLLWVALDLLWPHATRRYADHTVVDQAVTAAHALHKPLAGLVNGVLRRFLREREERAARALASAGKHGGLPGWWCWRVQEDWPEDGAEVLHAGAAPPPMFLRANPRRGDALAYAQRLQQQGLEASRWAWRTAQQLGADPVLLHTPRPVGQLPGFAQGDVSVQDAAAQLAAPLLLRDATDRSPAAAAIGPGARVLDACAAPGGKAAHLLELAPLDLLCLDQDAQRLQRVQHTLQRLGLSARLCQADATQPGTWWDGQRFDAILLDAPCSGSGVVRRHPDIPWLRRAQDLPALCRMQDALLDALWPLLRPGGRLLYATCSVFRDEGERRIDAFLQRTRLPRSVIDPASPGHLLPLPDNDSALVQPGAAVAADGFFYALLHKPL